MKRGVTLVSVAITAFSVVIVASVVYGYQVSARPQSVPLPAAVSSLEPRPSPELVSASSVASTRMSPKEAAALASEFLGRTDAYSVQLVEYNGVQAYKVTFTSGDIVYVSLDGKILGSELPTVQLASTGRQNRDDSDDQSRERDDDGEHEEHEVEHEDEAGG
jgi:hypothetical protein